MKQKTFSKNNIFLWGKGSIWCVVTRRVFRLLVKEFPVLTDDYTSSLGVCSAFKIQVLHSPFLSSVLRVEWISEALYVSKQSTWWMPMVDANGFLLLSMYPTTIMWPPLKDIPSFLVQWLAISLSYGFLFHMFSVFLFSEIPQHFSVPLTLLDLSGGLVKISFVYNLISSLESLMTERKMGVLRSLLHFYLVDKMDCVFLDGNCFSLK